MKTCKGSLLLEMMIGLVLAGVLLMMMGMSAPRTFAGSPEETPVVLMGLLNEEMRNAASKMSFNQIRVMEQTLVHSDHRLAVIKRSYIDKEVRIFFGGTFNPRFKASTSFNFEVNGSAAQSGRISFYRRNKAESVLMIHLGTLTMDVREP